jgi:hypothetical protein
VELRPAGQADAPFLFALAHPEPHEAHPATLALDQPPDPLREARPDGGLRRVSGSATLPPGKTLILAMQNITNGDPTQYGEFVVGWQDPPSRGTWRGAQFFGRVTTPWASATGSG